MLCSISTNNKSGSTWLDRLRTSKGFPVQTDLDLDHFLNPNPNLPNSPPQKQDEEQEEDIPSLSNTINIEKPHKSLPEMAKKSDDWFEIMSSVLSELFNMGDPRDIARIHALEQGRKRSFRKQSNPKICLLSSSGSVGESCLVVAGGVPALSPSSADNSIAEAKRSDDCLLPGKQGVADSAGPEEEISRAVAVDLDLSAFSRAEVTIIDTSAPVWKSEKLIFRKGSVWKIRDKKQSYASRRKRKVDQLDGRPAAPGEEKQQKRSPLPSKAGKEAACEERLISSNGGSTHNGKGKASKEAPDNLSQIIERRPQFSRSPRKPATKDSSVFLIQCIPTARKNDTSSSKNRLKDKL
ncbi:hypothetical protein AAC387_Pa06g0371 [Persea americana]